jgi:hypothetical protein
MFNENLSTGSKVIGREQKYEHGTLHGFIWGPEPQWRRLWLKSATDQNGRRPLTCNKKPEVKGDDLKRYV